MFRSCQWKGCRKACLPCSACWRRWVLACSKSTTHKTSREPWTGRHGFGIWRTHTDFPQFCFPWQCRVYLGQHRHRGRPCLYLCPNTKWPHYPHQNLQQSRPAVRGRGGAGALWRPSGTLCRQHKPAPSPNAAPPRCAKQGLHTCRDFAVRLRHGGSFQNHGGRAARGGFGIGNPLWGRMLRHCWPSPLWG